MSPPGSDINGMKCSSCGKLAANIHLCKLSGISQIVCDACCKSYLKNDKCHQRACGHYREI